MAFLIWDKGSTIGLAGMEREMPLSTLEAFNPRYMLRLQALTTFSRVKLQHSFTHSMSFIVQLPITRLV